MIDLSTQLRSYFDETNPPFDVSDVMTEEPPVAFTELPALGERKRWVTVAASWAAVIVLAVIGGAVWLLRGEEPIGSVDNLNFREVDDIPAFRATVENSSTVGRWVYEVSYEGPGGGMRWEIMEGAHHDPDTGEPDRSTTQPGPFGYVSSVWDGGIQAGQLVREDADLFERIEFTSRSEALSSEAGLWDLTWQTGGWSARCSGGETDPLRGTHTVVGSTEITGRVVTQIECSTTRQAWTVWVDTETGLVMRSEGRTVQFAWGGVLARDYGVSAGTLEVTSLEFDPDFPPDLFDVVVPPGAIDEDEFFDPNPSSVGIEDSVVDTAPFYLQARHNWPSPVRTVDVWWQSRDRWRVEIVGGDGAGSYAVAGESGSGFYDATSDTWADDPLARQEAGFPSPLVDTTPAEVFLRGGGVGPAFVPRFEESAAAIASAHPGESGCEPLSGGSILGLDVERWSCPDGDLAIDPGTGLVLEWIYEGTAGYEVLALDTKPVFDPSLFVFEPRGSERPADPLQQLVGLPAPEMRGELLRGAAFDLAELRGEQVVLLIWASWCGPCLDDLADFDAAAGTRTDLTFVTVLLQDMPAAAADAVATGGYSVPVVDVTPQLWFETWSVGGVPTTVFIDADGTVVDFHAGLLGFEGIRDLLEQLGW